MRTPSSLVALLHPEGAPAGIARVGPCPPWLAGDGLVDGAADVVVVGADRPEDAELIAGRGIACLRDGGIVVVAGRRGARREVTRSLAAAAGLHVVGSLVVVSAGPGPLVLATVDGAALGGALRDAHGPAARRAARLISKSRSLAWPVTRVLPTIEVCAGKDVGPLAAWLAADTVARPGSLVLRAGFEGSRRAAVVTRFRGGAPLLVGKVGLSESDREVGRREAEAIEMLGPAARDAGVRVPQAVGVVDVGGAPAAIMTPVAGDPASRARGRDAERLLSVIADWLVDWALATSHAVDGSPLVDDAVLAPAITVARDLELGARYVEELRGVAARTASRPLAASAAHGDLTLWNVLVDRGVLGVVDWEGARPVALPLVDLPYLIVDAVCARDGYRDRVAAFASCFSRGGADRSHARVLWESACRRLAVPDDVTTLAFQACWIGHAAEERRRGVDGVFSRIAALAARELG